ncbi:hypothetical protein BDV23DRAFT_18236 [Aspergillus alliaceus]|uniref:Uncharacterized protein n=1 Tax=Petromyces alliaceus TaxID=209559 RepID=A0A5N7BUR5_PETAA|nr:hypothetical protein BDV23DRAFT_18236 [Aspergillus alliaceus]
MNCQTYLGLYARTDLGSLGNEKIDCTQITRNTRSKTIPENYTIYGEPSRSTMRCSCLPPLLEGTITQETAAQSSRQLMSEAIDDDSLAEKLIPEYPFGRRCLTIWQPTSPAKHLTDGILAQYELSRQP